MQACDPGVVTQEHCFSRAGKLPISDNAEVVRFDAELARCIV